MKIVIEVKKGKDPQASLKRKGVLTMEMIDQATVMAHGVIHDLHEQYNRQTLYESWDMKEVPIEAL